MAFLILAPYKAKTGGLARAGKATLLDMSGAGKRRAPSDIGMKLPKRLPLSFVFFPS
jgi:hypothetical protein